MRSPERPEGWHLSASGCLGLYLVTRAEPARPPSLARPFLGRERVLEALARGILRADDTIEVGRRVTTAGRFLVAECLPPAYRDEAVEAPCTARRLASILSRVVRDEHVEIAGRAAEAMEILGRAYADRSGLSPARADFAPAGEKDAIVAEGLAEVARLRAEYWDGLITDGERYNKTVDQWAYVTDRTRIAAAKGAPADDALAAIAATDPCAPRPDHVRGSVGLLSKSSGEIVEVPVLSARGEGLTAHEFMITAQAARAARLTERERDRVAATLLHDIDAALGETKIVERDCRTTRSVRLGALLDGYDLIVSLATRIEGRVAAAHVVSSSGVVLAPAGSLLTRRVALAIEEAHVPWVEVRDPSTCESDGVCARCFGLDPEDATWLADGDPVGARAATTIARAARDFTERWFHIC